MKRFICVMFIFLIGCGGVSIKQRVSMNSYLDNTNLVSTQVWVRNWMGFPETLEYWETRRCTYAELDSVKKWEYEKALPTYYAVKKVLEGEKP